MLCQLLSRGRIHAIGYAAGHGHQIILVQCYVITDSQNKSTQSQISSATLAQATCSVASLTKGDPITP